MNTEQLDYFATREGVMGLLADDELRSVIALQHTPAVPPGEEYLDLEQLGHGIGRGPSTAPPMMNVLSKRAMRPATWIKIVAFIGAARQRAGARITS
jgi:hypothetical protein